MSRPTMTTNEVDLMAHEIRQLLQDRTCCPEHAGEVLLQVLAGMCLDDAEDNAHEAAATLKRAARRLAAQIRSGQLRMVRTAQ